jgi:hypothetical protein
LQFSDRVTNYSAARRHSKQITHPLATSDLPGTWESKSDNGHKTELTLRSNGSFVFDQSSDSTVHRVYLCGTWQGAEKSLALVVKAAKRQLEDGAIEQAAGTYSEAATILSAQQNRIILRIQGEKLVFNRTS